MDAARWLLSEAVSPPRFDLSRLRELPLNIYYTPNGGSEEHLRLPDPPKPSEEERRRVYEMLGKEMEESPEPEPDPEEQALPLDPVTEEALSSLLVRFGRDELERLELHWFQGNLVLRRDGGKYACLYFEGDFGHGEDWYALLSDVEMYRTVDYKAVIYLPFGMGKLPAYSVHSSAASIMGSMEDVLAQMGWGKLQSGGQGGWMWSCAANRQ
ncbi:MAG: hypothetical protein K2K53_12050, partial [Oscillospiraceae bacterium]|nr:hypothetical protein [Oscillospiraceae bacterium]